MNDNTRLVEELAESVQACERLFVTTFEHSGVGMVHARRDGRWLRVNEAFARTLGYRRDELEGRSFRDFRSHEDSAEAESRQDNLHSDDQKSAHFSERLVRSDGTPIELEVHASYHPDSDLDYFVILESMPDHARYETDSYLAALVDSSADAIIGKRLDGTIMTWNRGAQLIYGYTADEMIGRPVHLLAPPHLQMEVIEMFAKISAGEAVTHYETEQRNKSGERIDVSLTVSPVRDRFGQIVGASTIGRDITQRKAAEQKALGISNVQDKVFSSVNVSLAYLGRDFRVLKVNRAFTEHMGRSRNHLEGENFFALYPNAEDEAIVHHVVDTGEPFSASERPFHAFTSPQGEIRYWDWGVQPVKDEAGGVEGIVFSLVDVSEKVEIKNRLTAATSYARGLIEASLDPLLTIDTEGIIRDVNAATENVIGRSRRAIIGSDFSDYFTAPGSAKEAYRKALQERLVRDYPLEIRRADGYTTPVLYNAASFRDENGNVRGVIVVARDVTVSRQTENALRVSLLKYRTLLNTFNFGVSVTDSQGRIIESNPASEKLLGIGAGEHLRRRADSPEWQVITPEGDPLPPEEFAGIRAIKEKRLVENQEMGVLKENGKITWISVNAAPIPLEEYGVVITCVDITRRKQTEEALRQSERRYRSLFEHIFDGYAVHEIILDEQGKPDDYRFLEVNPAFEKILGLSREQVVGKRASEILPRNELQWVEIYGRVALTGEEVRFEQYAREFDRFFEVTAFSHAKHEFATLLSDVTERRRAGKLLELRTREQEAIASVGLSALSGLALKALMDQGVRTIADTLQVELCEIYELSEDGSELMLVAGTGWKDQQVGLVRVSADESSQAGYTLVNRSAVLTENLDQESRFTPSAVLREQGAVSSMSVVVQGRDRLFGVLGAHSRERRQFTHDDVNFLQAIANVIAAAVEHSRAEAALTAASAYNRRLIETSLDPLVTIGPDGKITDVNAATEAVTGRTRDRLIGTDFADYFTDSEKARVGFRQAFEAGFVRDYPLELRHANGKTMPVLYNVSVYRDEAGEIVGVFAAARDITEQKRSEEVLRRSEARLVQAQRIAHIGSWELDFVNNELIWSDEIFCIFEIDPEKFGATYEAFLNAIHPDDRAAVDFAYTKSVETRTPYSIDHRLLFPYGRVKYVHEQCETYYAENGRPLRSLGTVQDITERKRAEEEVQRLSQRNKLLLESAGEGIYGIDPEGRCTFVNPAAVKMLGYGKPEDLIGRSAHETFHYARPDGSRYPESQCPVDETLKKGGVFRGADEVYWRKDGSGFPVEFFSTPIREEERLVGAVIGFLDITERKRAEEALRVASAYNRRLIEASLDPLVTIGPEGKITDVNAATETVTGRGRDELIGTDFAEYFTDAEQAREGYRKVFQAGFVRDYPLEIRHLDGRTTAVVYNASTFLDETGRVAGVFAAARDVSERRRAEEALRRSESEVRQLNAELEQRVRQRTAELENANHELESFSFSVSHDLRAPLRAINGFSKILLTDYEATLDDEAKRLLRIVRANTEKMSQLISDILAFSRTSRAEIKTADVEMQTLVQECWIDVKPTESERLIEIRVGKLPRARGDRALLRQVFINLLSNAVKFTRPREQAIIEVGGEVKEGESVYFVKDNGVGFDMRYADKLYGVFQRLHATDEFEGTGIGLAIVKRIVTRHGGRVWAEARVGEGATFHFTLPQAEMLNG